MYVYGNYNWEKENDVAETGIYTEQKYEVTAPSIPFTNSFFLRFLFSIPSLISFKNYSLTTSARCVMAVIEVIAFQ